MSGCPFYRGEGEKSVHCEGGKFIRFLNSSDKDEFYLKYCSKMFERCTVCKKNAAEKGINIVRLKKNESEKEKESADGEEIELNAIGRFVAALNSEIGRRGLNYKQTAEMLGVSTARLFRFIEMEHRDVCKWYVIAKKVSEVFEIELPCLEDVVNC